jgi:putative endonuclease
MRDHIKTGKLGEDLAIGYLEHLHFQILHRNWRYRRSEIDIIASRHELLHIIEVKTRRTRTFGYPEESISPKKLAALMAGGVAFMSQHRMWTRIQYDVLSINLTSNSNPEFFLIEDVYL